jgi:hypothetical protein
MERRSNSLADRARLKGLDPEEVMERAAIMEIDGGLPRWKAERYALEEWKPTDEELLVHEKDFHHETRN